MRMPPETMLGCGGVHVGAGGGGGAKGFGERRLGPDIPVRDQP